MVRQERISSTATGGRTYSLVASAMTRFEAWREEITCVVAMDQMCWTEARVLTFCVAVQARIPCGAAQALTSASSTRSTLFSGGATGSSSCSCSGCRKWLEGATDAQADPGLTSGDQPAGE